MCRGELEALALDLLRREEECDALRGSESGAKAALERGVLELMQVRHEAERVRKAAWLSNRILRGRQEVLSYSGAMREWARRARTLKRQQAVCARLSTRRLLCLRRVIFAGWREWGLGSRRQGRGIQGMERRRDAKAVTAAFVTWRLSCEILLREREHEVEMGKQAAEMMKLRAMSEGEYSSSLTSIAKERDDALLSLADVQSELNAQRQGRITDSEGHERATCELNGAMEALRAEMEAAVMQRESAVTAQVTYNLMHTLNDGYSANATCMH